MYTGNRLYSAWVWAVVLGAPLAVRGGEAGELPPQFTLGRYVPDDCWMFMQFAANTETVWIEEQRGRVWKALEESGIARDIVGLVFSLLSEADRAEAQVTLDKVTELIRGVSWNELACQEFAFAERLGAGFGGYEYMALLRGKPGTAERNAAGLAAIMEEIATRAKVFRVVKDKLHGCDRCCLQLAPREQRTEIELALSVLRKDDTIAIVFGERAAEQVAGLLYGKTEPRTMAASPRFRKAISEVKAPEDAVMLFDMKMLLGQFPKVVEAAERGLAPDTPSPRREAKRGAFESAVELADFVDYAVHSVETVGHRQFTHGVVRLQAGKEKTPVARALFARQPFSRFDQYIPAEATGFSLEGFVDLEGAYKIVTDFVREKVPDGAAAIDRWNEWLKTNVGLDPERDLFSWWGGEMISVSLPATVITPARREDSVLMIRVKDSALATAKLSAAITFVEGIFKGQQPGLVVQPAAVKAEGFREITHPLAAMWVRPVIGVAGEWLIVGTSADAINKCLAVAAKEAPSIRENDRFRKEGLVPDGPVVSASFTDTSRFGEELAEGVAMIGMIGGMIPMFAAGNLGEGEEAAQAKKVIGVIQKATTIISKLGPVLQKIDYYSSEASMATFDGTVLRDTSVVTYKDPAAVEKIRTAKSEPQGR
ncbi:MAG: hypothetical protein HY763_10870 [Planctomycetes bacterium]|nr:hypothetical protein [Planctomycetota bacterium]